MTFAYNGDVNNNNAINLPDLGDVLTNFMLTGPNDADANGDGNVGLLDLGLVLVNYGLSGQN